MFHGINFNYENELEGDEPYFGLTNDMLGWGVEKFDVEKCIVYYLREDIRVGFILQVVELTPVLQPPPPPTPP